LLDSWLRLQKGMVKPGFLNKINEMSCFESLEFYMLS